MGDNGETNGVLSRLTSIKALPPIFETVEPRARELSALMPSLILSARQIAQTLVHGSHGRKRAGPGETFWQFRPYESFEPVHRIDWRRSASSDHLYVREREWDTAHTFWIWIDLSSSMWFQSRLSRTSKAARAILFGLAVAELLVQSGERVGVLGLMRPAMDRDVVPRIAERIVAGFESNPHLKKLPTDAEISRFSELILISDFLDPMEGVLNDLARLGSNQVGGTLMQIIDPVEESFPYSGRVEFKDMGAREKIIVENAVEIAPRYKAAFEARKQQLKECCRRLNWGHLIAHTDRPAREGLLTLHGFLSSHYYSTGAMSHEAKGQSERELI